MPKPNIGQGDRGKTSLIGGSKKVLKSSLRIESCGALDELVSLIGYIKTQSKNKNFRILLEQIQDHLFRIECHVVSVLNKKDSFVLPYIGQEHVKFLEDNITSYEKNLPQLENFILPGGTQLAAQLHIARAQTRRVERILVRTSQKNSLHPFALPYINRLSDVFFILARWTNHDAGAKETKWIGIEKSKNTQV
jgi:cob(I)alamin adenosyltransferase